jgi:hypothetical protein
MVDNSNAPFALPCFAGLLLIHTASQIHILSSLNHIFIESIFNQPVMPPLRTRTRKSRPATSRLNASTVKEIPSIASARLASAPLTATNSTIGSAIESSVLTIQPSLSLMNPAAPMLGIIAVAAMTAPAPAASSL